MSKDLTKIALATISAVVVLDILTHGNAAVGIANAIATGWAGILKVLAGTPQNYTG